MVESVGAHGVDKEKPVDGDESGGGDEDFERGPGGERFDKFGESFGEREDEEEDGESEDDALREDLDGGGAVLGEGAEEEGDHDGPPAEGAGGEEESFAFVELVLGFARGGCHAGDARWCFEEGSARFGDSCHTVRELDCGREYS